MGERRMVLNGDRLVRTRLTGRIVPTAANRVVAPDGRLRTLPGQGGVVVGIGPGDPAAGWAGDHVEPGISLGHPEEAANRALQVLSCVGNRVTMLDGPAAGAVGVVVGKHGQVLAQLARVAHVDREALQTCDRLTNVFAADRCRDHRLHVGDIHTEARGGIAADVDIDVAAAG